MVTTDEHITEMIVWSKADRVHGVQFVTSMGRVSPHYGNEKGMIPKHARSKGGVLGGLSSVVRWDGEKKDFLLIQFEVSTFLRST